MQQAQQDPTISFAMGHEVEERERGKKRTQREVVAAHDGAQAANSGDPQRRSVGAHRRQGAGISNPTNARMLLNS